MPSGVYRHKKGSLSSRWKNGVIKNDGYRMVYAPLHPRATSTRKPYVYEHVLLAEYALRRALPPQAEVHHVNKIRDDNTAGNLVLCENRGYHRLLHMRTEALQHTGCVTARRCSHCKQWEVDLNTGSINSRTFRHKACHAAYMRRHKRKES